MSTNWLFRSRQYFISSTIPPVPNKMAPPAPFANMGNFAPYSAPPPSSGSAKPKQTSFLCTSQSGRRITFEISWRFVPARVYSSDVGSSTNDPKSTVCLLVGPPARCFEISKSILFGQSSVFRTIKNGHTPIGQTMSVVAMPDEDLDVFAMVCYWLQKNQLPLEEYYSSTTSSHPPLLRSNPASPMPSTSRFIVLIRLWDFAHRLGMVLLKNYVLTSMSSIQRVMQTMRVMQTIPSAVCMNTAWNYSSSDGCGSSMRRMFRDWYVLLVDADSAIEMAQGMNREVLIDLIGGYGRLKFPGWSAAPQVEMYHEESVGAEGSLMEGNVRVQERQD